MRFIHDFDIDLVKAVIYFFHYNHLLFTMDSITNFQKCYHSIENKTKKKLETNIFLNLNLFFCNSNTAHHNV